jgi:two-component system response regulator AtoC
MNSTAIVGVSSATVLLVEDEPTLRRAVAMRLGREGWIVVEASTGQEGLEALETAGIDLVLLDQGLPDGDGADLVSRIRDISPDTVVIVLTGNLSVASAVRAIQQGAYNYLTKPVDLEQLAVVVRRALEARALGVHLGRTRRAEQGADSGVIGTSTEMVRVKGLIAKYARSPASTVLVTGESGTGKDLAARSLHERSDRAAGPFTTITCSAMPEALLESELFGHEKGAFTGAHQQKKGLLELSDQGTVFLDEIGELSLVLQAKLLRFLESKTFRRVGGSKDLTPDVRVVAATNRDLRQDVAAGRFREDLFYRLSVLRLHLPPLRQRRQDIPALVAHFVARFDREFHKHVQDVTETALAMLVAHDWPGNVRELRNAVERAMLLAEGTRLGERDFEMLLDGAVLPATPTFVLPAEGVDLAALERSLVAQALARTGGNRTRAGKLLGLNRDQIRYRLAKDGDGLKSEHGED